MALEKGAGAGTASLEAGYLRGYKEGFTHGLITMVLCALTAFLIYTFI